MCKSALIFEIASIGILFLLGFVLSSQGVDSAGLFTVASLLTAFVLTMHGQRYFPRFEKWRLRSRTSAAARHGDAGDFGHAA